MARDSAATGGFGDCRMPAEFAQLPRSRALVMTQYAIEDAAQPSGRISVLDTRGRVLASYAYPRIVTPSGVPLDVHPREVVADPLGRSGDERFVVIFDAERGSGQASAAVVPGAMQEFRYDAEHGLITPTSAPVLTGDVRLGESYGFETAAYGADGSLWAGQSIAGTLQAGPLAIYHRAAGSRGTLGERASCGASPSWRGQAWGRACAPDERIAQAADLGIARSLDPDPATGAMYLTTMSGDVLPVRPTSVGTHEAGPALDLGLDQLADRSIARIGPRKAALDAARHVLWVPIQQLATPQTCVTWPCPPQRLDQWLMRVDVRKLG